METWKNKLFYKIIYFLKSKSIYSISLFNISKLFKLKIGEKKKLHLIFIFKSGVNCLFVYKKK